MIDKKTNRNVFYTLAIEKTTFNATIIVAGINKTNKALNTSFNRESTGLIFDINTKVEFPCPLTITRVILAKRNVFESLSPELRYPIKIPNITSIM